MKLQSLALVFLAFALAAASADTALDTGDADVDNVVDGELTEQELDREDDEPIQEDEDDNDLDIENLNDRELESNLEEESDLDRLAGEESDRRRDPSRPWLHHSGRCRSRRTCYFYRRGYRNGLRKGQTAKCSSSVRSATGDEPVVSDRWSMGKIRKKIRRAVRKALRRERRKLMRGLVKIMRRRSKEVRSCVNATRDIQRLLG